MWSSVIFGSVRVIFAGLARSLVVFEIYRLASGSLRFNLGYLRCNLHSCYTFLHCVTLLCTVLTKNALHFSQSELSNFFKCIIRTSNNITTGSLKSVLHMYYLRRLTIVLGLGSSRAR